MTTGMSIAIVIVVIIAGLMAWRSRQRNVRMASIPREEMSPADLAHKAFVHGNTCLAKKEFTEALASFEQALDLNPRHPHAANRHAEAERCQSAQAKEAPHTAA